MIEKLFRSISVFKGKQRLVRLLFRNRIKNGKDIIIKGDYNCIYKVPNIKENIGLELFANGIYERETIDFIVDKLPVNGIFCDIGANIGAVVLPVCKRRKDIQALAIEASTNVYNYLTYNLKENKIGNCNLLNKAVSDKSGEIVNFYSPDEKFGKGSMAAVFTIDGESIETITLDSLVVENKLEKVDFLKIDVEGFEYFVFKGAEKLLNTANAPCILFEFVDWAEELTKICKPGDAQKLLLEYGYYLWVLGNKNKLTRIYSPVTKGALMIWATKQP